eukprot:m.226958 g.226958  ORF g.226958 m.226958 type:complete len:346 (-) comp33508_c3_seq1:286-1323(-)
MMVWSLWCHTTVVVVVNISLLFCVCVQSEQPRVVDEMLSIHDVSMYVNRKQCRNFYDVAGVSREAITACMLPIFNTTVSRITRGSVDGQIDPDTGAVSWIQKCYDTLKDLGPQTTSSMSKTWRMGTNVVVHKPNNVYVDVVKSGSESVRHVLAMQGVHKKWGRKLSDRTMSREITREQHDYFTWSLVRDPIPRFLSSFQQAVKQRVCRHIGLEPEQLAGSQSEQQRCFDWCISQLLQGNIVNEHFQSQSYRLLTQDSENQLLDYSFVGQLESVTEYWPNLFQQLFKGTNRSTYGSHSMPHRLHPGIDVKVNISPWHILALCNYYAQDFVCFRYELPTVCGALQHD